MDGGLLAVGEVIPADNAKDSVDYLNRLPYQAFCRRYRGMTRGASVILIAGYPAGGRIKAYAPRSLYVNPSSARQALLLNPANAMELNGHPNSTTTVRDEMPTRNRRAFSQHNL